MLTPPLKCFLLSHISFTISWINNLILLIFLGGSFRVLLFSLIGQAACGKPQIHVIPRKKNQDCYIFIHLSQMDKYGVRVCFFFNNFISNNNN